MSWKDTFGFTRSMDTKGTSYKCEMVLAGQVLKLYSCMAKLLVHPLQQLCQSHTSYSLLEEDEVPTEAEVSPNHPYTSQSSCTVKPLAYRGGSQTEL